MNELPWLRSLVKHNVAAKHGSSKPLTSNELWLLELRIKSSRILASILDALWDMCKSSITPQNQKGIAWRNSVRSVQHLTNAGMHPAWIQLLRNYVTTLTCELTQKALLKGMFQQTATINRSTHHM